MMSNFHALVLGANDDFINVSNSFSGLSEILQVFMGLISGACQIPQTKLFGDSPSGMNATGESDLKNYFLLVEQEQDSQLGPALDKLMPVLARSSWGDMPDDMDYRFNPIQEVSEDKIGNTVKWKTDALFGAHDRGIITDQLALKELQQLSTDTGLFTNITDEDVNKASNEIEDPTEPELEQDSGDDDDE
jgi:phage-related protein (TIGR01555 family)